MKNKIIVPDVSFYQDSPLTVEMIDFPKMRTKSPGVIIRAGQNLWKDSDFDHNWKASKAAELLRGAYWFYDSRVSPIDQADLFISVVGDDFPELGYWGDFEENYGGPYGGWENFLIFMEYLRVKLRGRLVGIYTGPGYWNRHKPERSVDLNKFSVYPLWVANYKTNYPDIPQPWTNYLFWQFTAEGPGVDYGVESKEIDLNYFYGSEEEFKEYFSFYEDIPTENNEGDVIVEEKIVTAKGKIVAMRGARLREEPSVASKSMGIYPYGSNLMIDKIKTISANEEWAHVVDIDGIPVEGWVAVLYLGDVITSVVESKPQEQTNTKTMIVTGDFTVTYPKE